MRTYDPAESRDFKELLADDPDVMSVLSQDDLDRCFDLVDQLRHVGPIVDRVLARASESGDARGMVS